MLDVANIIAPLPESIAKGRSRSEIRLVAAMSGGVDSSVAAAALHHAGYDVVGVTLQLYDHGEAVENQKACCAGKDIYDAAAVARDCGFPHYIFNYQDVFKREVIEEFAESYVRGETPVPCIDCNQSVKFRDLMKAAKDLGADALVTGHYIRRAEGENGAELRRARDRSKDQSYFLYATTQEQLDYMYFPLGGMEKTEVRALADALALDIADKPESQDICFVPNGKYGDLVARLRPGALDSGPIMHVNGEKIGEHNGVIHYTVGQRRGLGIGWHEPLYVIKLDPANNCVVVGPESALDVHVFYIGMTNWLIETTRNRPIKCDVRHRSMHPGAPAQVTPLDEKTAKVEMLSPERAVTPGQACVFYEGDRVLGGGRILREEFSPKEAAA